MGYYDYQNQMDAISNAINLAGVFEGGNAFDSLADAEEAFALELYSTWMYKGKRKRDDRQEMNYTFSWPTFPKRSEEHT